MPRAPVSFAVALAAVAAAVMLAHAPQRSEAVGMAPAVQSISQRQSFDGQPMTARRFHRMKRQWTRDKAKWAGCNKLVRDLGLRGRRSWPVIAECMTK